MVIYSGAQRIFQISKWRAAAQVICIFGLALKIKTKTETEEREREGGKKVEGRRDKKKREAKEKE